MKYWIVPHNSKKFKLEEALRINKGFVDWRIKKVSVGDIVFLYSAKPLGYIKHMFNVVATDFIFEESINKKEFWTDKDQFKQGNGTFVRLKLIGILNERVLTAEALSQHGVNGNIQSKRECTPETLKFILNSLKK